MLEDLLHSLKTIQVWKQLEYVFVVQKGDLINKQDLCIIFSCEAFSVINGGKLMDSSTVLIFWMVGYKDRPR